METYKDILGSRDVHEVNPKSDIALLNLAFEGGLDDDTLIWPTEESIYCTAARSIVKYYSLK